MQKRLLFKTDYICKIPLEGEGSRVIFGRQSKSKSDGIANLKIFWLGEANSIRDIERSQNETRTEEEMGI